MNETITTLISVSLGAVLAFLSSYLTENRRWKREQKKELSQDKRKAISQSLRWVDPMKNASIKIKAASIAFVNGRISHEELFERWPNLLNQLKDIDVRHDLATLLPKETFRKSPKITILINKILPMTVATGQSFSSSNHEINKRGWQRFNILIEKLNQLQAEIESFEGNLRDNYLNTYKY